MPARTGQQYIDSLKRMSPCVYLNGRLVEGRHRGAGVPGRDQVDRRAVRPAARPALQRLHALRVADYRRPGTRVVPGAEDEAGAGQQAQGVQAAHRPQLRLHGPHHGLHERPGHRLVPGQERFARRGAQLRRERRALLRVRARERPVSHPRADQPADRPLAYLGGAGGAVPAPRQGRRRRRRASSCAAPRCWARWRRLRRRSSATRSAAASPRATTSTPCRSPSPPTIPGSS